MKRIPAFTMVELLVVMVLSAIIISFAYNVFLNADNSFNNAVVQYGKTNELLQFQTLINNDCSNAILASYYDNELRVEKLDHTFVNYLFSSDNIVRKDGVSREYFQTGTYITSIFYLFDCPPLVETIILEFQGSETISYTLTAQISYTNKTKFVYRKLDGTNNQSNGN